MAKDKSASKKDEAKGKVKGADATAEAAKLAKREARKEALKARPDGQRQNSKQIDTLTVGKTTVETFGCSVRKTGTLVTTVIKNEKGDAIAVAVTFVPGVKVKAKKGHGMLQPGVAGEGKKKKGAEEDED